MRNTILLGRLFTIVSVACTVHAAPAPAGLLVHRSGDRIAFSEAYSLLINGKDKVLKAGREPIIAGPINKLPNERPNGTLLLDGKTSSLVEAGDEGSFQYLVPSGTPKNAAPDLKALWAGVKVSFKPSPADKTPTEIAATDVIAFVPSGPSGLPALCSSAQMLRTIHGSADSQKLQADLVAGAARAYAGQPVAATLNEFVRSGMQRNMDRFLAGTESGPSIAAALHFAAISQAAFADDPQHKSLRDVVRAAKQRLDRRMALLKALGAGSQWDAFIAGYREFEKHQASYPDMASAFREALKQSLSVHRAAGNDRLSRREYKSAWRELRLASYREPSNSALQKELSVAWTEYSREIAVSRQQQRPQLTLGQRQEIDRSLYFATQYKSQGKLDDALKSVQDAEAIHANDLSVLLAKAQIYDARNEIVKALQTLDQYDLNAVDQERTPASTLRNQLLFRLATALAEQKKQVAAAWSAEQYFSARRMALQGLNADDRDPDLLYYAGLSSLVTRDVEQGRKYLTKYLEVSSTVDASPERRNNAYRALNIQSSVLPSSAGEKNWLSGRAVPAGSLYCPLSLAFTPKVDRIAASNKLSVQFTWNGDQLRSITSAFEKPTDSTGEKSFVFSYDPRITHVAQVAEEGSASPRGAAEDDILKRLNVFLPNNELIDPGIYEVLTGKKRTVVVAGNKYFHPFVWQSPHYFLVTHDEQGRMTEAREIAGATTPAGSEVILEFDWNGFKLQGIKGYRQAGAGSARVQSYERRQLYQDDRLIGEEIRFGNKSAKIKYTYNGSTLVSAECDKDESLDSRSREVFFASAAAPGGRQRR